MGGALSFYQYWFGCDFFSTGFRLPNTSDKLLSPQLIANIQPKMKIKFKYSNNDFFTC